MLQPWSHYTSILLKQQNRNIYPTKTIVYAREVKNYYVYNKTRKAVMLMPIEYRLFLCKLLNEMKKNEASSRRIGISDESTYRGIKIADIQKSKFDKYVLR